MKKSMLWITIGVLGSSCSPSAIGLNRSATSAYQEPIVEPTPTPEPSPSPSNLSDGLPLDQQRIFVSAPVFGYELGNGSADRVCKNEASAAGLGRTYRALLADSANLYHPDIPSDRPISMLDRSGNLSFVTPDLETIIYSNYMLDSVRFLADGTLADRQANPLVWTGLDQGGIGYHCSDWNDSVGFGTVGMLMPVGYNTFATTASYVSCSTQARVYCISD